MTSIYCSPFLVSRLSYVLHAPHVYGMQMQVVIVAELISGAQGETMDGLVPGCRVLTVNEETVRAAL
jgi:hypothetical protein